MLAIRHVMAYSLLIFVTTSGLQSAHAGLLITQYYYQDLPSRTLAANDPAWLELYNNSSAPINLSGLALGVWRNANTEGYKSNINPSSAVLLSGTISPGSTYLITVPGNTPVHPSYAVPDNLNSLLIVDGNDSFAIYKVTNYLDPNYGFLTANIEDAIGFTRTGYQGKNTSWVRISSDPGWNTTPGSNVTSFPTVWQQFTTAAVDAAGPTSNPERLGISGFAPPYVIPEPGSLTLLLTGIAALGAVTLRRNNRRGEI